MYEERRIDRLQAQEQLAIEQFDRSDTGVVWRDRRGKGKGVVDWTPMAYVIEEETELPPLTGTGPLLNMFVVLTAGIAGGYVYSRKTSQY